MIYIITNRNNEVVCYCNDKKIAESLLYRFKDTLRITDAAEWSIPINEGDHLWSVTIKIHTNGTYEPLKVEKYESFSTGIAVMYPSPDNTILTTVPARDMIEAIKIALKSVIAHVRPLAAAPVASPSVYAVEKMSQVPAEAPKKEFRSLFEEYGHLGK